MVAPRGMDLVMKKKRRIRDYSDFFYYTYGYTTGYLGMWLSLRGGENAPVLRMTVNMPRTDCTESLKRCGGAIEGDETYQPGLIIRWVRTCRL